MIVAYADYLERRGVFGVLGLPIQSGLPKRHLGRKVVDLEVTSKL